MKNRDLNFLLIGIIITLVTIQLIFYFFGFNIQLLPIPTSWLEFFTAIGTVASAAAAVFFGLGGKEYLFKPDMKLIDKYMREAERMMAGNNSCEGVVFVGGKVLSQFFNMIKVL